MLASHKVSLYRFLRSHPWQLTDETHKNANKNKINLQNYRNANKVTKQCVSLYYAFQTETKLDTIKTQTNVCKKYQHKQ